MLSGKMGRSDLGAVRSWLGGGENPCSEADVGCQRQDACARALAGGHGAEQDGRGERGEGDG